MHSEQTPRLELEVRSHLLDNGLRIVLQPAQNVPLVATHVSYDVGSAQDPPGRSGLGHLFEHLFFLGSEHVGPRRFFHHIQMAGGSANGSTWYDRTTYFQTLPSEHLELALWLESDRMGFFRAALTENDLEVQRDIVLSERRQRFDNQPYGRVHERLHELLFPPEHPYRRPVIGSPEDIRSITIEDLSRYFDDYYSPDNAVLCLAGDFDPEWALERVEAYFGPLQRHGERPRPTVPPSHPPSERARQVIPDRVGLPRFYVSFLVPPYPSASWYAADLLSTALTVGRSSWLHEDLVRRRQLAQAVSSHVLPTRLGSTFTLAVTCRADSDAAEVEGTVLETLERVAEGELPMEQIERAKNRRLTTLCRTLQRLSERTDQLARAALYLGDAALLSEELTRYRLLESEEAARVARQHLRPSAGVTVLYVPEHAASEATQP